MTNIDPSVVLAEFEDLLRTAPPLGLLREQTDENVQWIGRAQALMDIFDIAIGGIFRLHVDSLMRGSHLQNEQKISRLLQMIHEARMSIRLKTVGPLSVAVRAGRPFDYFDELRKVLETATKDVLFVDPYLEAEFVSRYLPQLRPEVAVRLLTSNKKLAQLLPAAELFARQNNRAVEVHVNDKLHDRIVVVDRANVYLSGASFKDGAKSSHAMITQVTDMAGELIKQYEPMWAFGQVAGKWP